MSIRKKLKKIVPVSISRMESCYAELQRENAELKEMIVELQEALKGNRRELHDTHLDTQKIRAEVHSVFENVQKTKEEVHSVHENTQKIKEEVYNEHQKVIAIKENVYNSGLKTNELWVNYNHVEKSRLDTIEKVLELNSYGITKEKRDKKIIVSLTSYSKRIETLPLVLDRLLCQTVKPDYIILYLAKENFPDGEKELPERLLEMKLRGLDIRWCNEDIKSYKKIIPALVDFPDDIIITVDDDIYYDLDLVEKLINSYKKNPQAISALRVHRMLFNDEMELLPYSEWIKDESAYVNSPRMDLFATTGAGTLFPPLSLGEEVMNIENFMKLCPNADDVWINFMRIMNNIPIVLAAPCKELNYISGTQEEALWKTNVLENDIQIKQVLNVYNEIQEEDSTLIERIFLDTHLLG